MTGFMRIPLAAVAVLGFAFSASAQDYPSRAITVIVPYPAGGPTDQLARVLAPKFTEKLGQNVIVENMLGAGGLLAANYIARRAPRDGSEMATFIQSLVLSARVGQSGVEIDPRTINWIGNPASDEC